MSPYTVPLQVATFPLELGETIVWWRKSTHPSNPDGYEIRVRTASGFESMHDTYSDIVPVETRTDRYTADDFSI